MYHKRAHDPGSPALNIRLQPELKKRVQEAATRMGVTPSVYVRLVLVERLGLKPKAATMKKGGAQS